LVRDDGPVRRLLAVLIAATAALASGCSYTTRDIAPRLPVEAQSSKLYAADGSLITTLHAEENRENVPLAQIPIALRNAVIAIEDARFYHHKGVDPRAIVRAARRNTESGGVEQGGSTITQQYVKNALIGSKRTLKRKVQEAALAIQLERRYTKDKILELYLNTIYFGNGAYGVQAAAQEYFAKPAEDLTLTESALLAALIRSPATTDPFDRPAAALARRNLVLAKMGSEGYLTTAEVTFARGANLGLRPPATTADRYPAAHFVEEVKRFVLDDPRFGDTPAARRALLFTGGLRIHTTVDLRLQAAAEAAVARVLPDPGRDPDASLVALDPATGEVRAMVGGRDFFGGGAHAKLNLATHVPGRQAGSSFKPFVLAAALADGIPLSATFPAPDRIAIPLAGGQRWDVHNYSDGEGGGRMNLVEATVHSVNTVYAQLMVDVGPKEAMNTAARLGIRTPLRANPSAVLGTNEVTPLDMASAYGTFANRGVAVPPVVVTRITRPDGTVLYEHHHAQHKVLAPAVADQVTAVLEQVVQRGTGKRADIARPAAGKTGTADEWQDAWFCGYTPTLATAVWVGFADAQIPMAPPRTPIRVVGGTYPAQIWHDFMTEATAGTPPAGFHTPESVATPPAPEATGELVAVRNVVGVPYDVARATLAAIGFTVQRIDVPTADATAGTVIEQTPLAGAGAPAGSAIVLRVATGMPATVAVPDVLGLDVDAAQKALTDAGLVPEPVGTPSPAAGVEAGTVWKQRPAGGNAVPNGATVTLWVEPRSRTG
jgi:penicillin-binding protein 1A